MGYGTGAIMAVPGEDQRDWDFATEFDLPIVRTVAAPELTSTARRTPATARRSAAGSSTASTSTRRRPRIIDWLEEHGAGAGTVTYKLRDWLFSRQRYWGEPFPIVYDDDGLPVALPDSMLPVELPDLDDFEPAVLDDAADDTPPEPPLARAGALGRGDASTSGTGRERYRRGDEHDAPVGGVVLVLPALPRPDERRAGWSIPTSSGTGWTGRAGGGVDLYVGGVEHAVLHLLYARFWHKVLFDLGYVSTDEPFHRLFNQGYIQASAYRDGRGFYVEARRGRDRRRRRSGSTGEPVTREFGKMGKSLRNVVTPDDIYRDYGADTLRLYEMFMGPLDASRPWSTTDIVGVHRFLQRVWRNVVDEDERRGPRRRRPRRPRDPPHPAPHHRRGPRRHGRS